MTKRIPILLLALSVGVAAGVGGFVAGKRVGQRQQAIQGLISAAQGTVAELSYLRAAGFAQTNHLYHLEVILDCYLMSASELSSYSDLCWVEQDRLQDIKRYRTVHQYDVPTNFVAGMIHAHLVHPKAQAYLDSFAQEQKRTPVW